MAQQVELTICADKTNSSYKQLKHAYYTVHNKDIRQHSNEVAESSVGDLCQHGSHKGWVRPARIVWDPVRRDGDVEACPCYQQS